MSKPTLLIVTSQTCSACQAFKRSVQPSLRSKLQRDNRIQVGEIDLPTMSAPIPSTYPAELRKYIGWYPTFILLAPSRGNGVEGVVFNGKMVNGRINGPVGNRPISVEGISAWLDEELSGNPLFTTSKLPSFGSRPAGYRGMTYRPSNH